MLDKNQEMCYYVAIKMKGTKRAMFAAILTTAFTYFFFSFGFYWSRSVSRVQKAVGKRYCS